ncbi:MAG: hypothetical protein QOI66_4192, partial [Myxococcales bacterium]|nr:hypothetical protein [Myxococcales bacterium]
TGDKHPFAVPFFNTCFQRMQRSWWRAALTPRNPYTGRSLIDDPALAFIEIVNEDSVFFPTFTPYDGVPAPQMQILERLFAEWLRTHREPTLAQTFARWGGGALRGDDAPGGRAGLMPPGDVVSRRDARARDTAEFLTELQRHYYDDTYRYLKAELGFKGSVTGSNWITADARVLGPLDKWSNAGCDFIDRHGYFGGPHEGATASYQISAGDTYDDALALRFETGRPGKLSFALPLMDLAYQGKPSVISELGWPAPNRYRTDLPVLAAAYGALQGSDAIFFFAMEGSSWSDHLANFTIADPALVGLFPAAALLYRRGLVKTAEPVVHLEADLAGLQALKGLPIAAPHNLDQLRMEGAMPRGRGAGGMNSDGIDPLAFLAGRVEVNITRGGGVSKTADLSALIDRRGRLVRSATGELAWDWGRGLATVDAPQAQGATGLLGQTKAIALRDVTIMSGNDYGSVLLVALDGQPLRSSARMLLQVMTEDQNTGWSAPGQGLRRILDPGGQPLVVKNIAGRVTFKRNDAADLKVSALDFNGYPVETFRLGAAKELVLRSRTLYYVLQR